MEITLDFLVTKTSDSMDRLHISMYSVSDKFAKAYSSDTVLD